MVVEGPLPPGMEGGMVGLVAAGAGPLLVGSVPTTSCVAVVILLAGIPVLMGGRNMGPPPTIPPEKGSKFVSAMGIDCAVTRFSSEW